MEWLKRLLGALFPFLGKKSSAPEGWLEQRPARLRRPQSAAADPEAEKPEPAASAPAEQPLRAESAADVLLPVSPRAERIRPVSFETDPIPRVRHRAVFPPEPVPGSPWERDDTGNVTLESDAGIRAEEKGVQDLFSIAAPQEDSAPQLEDEDVCWAPEEEAEEEPLGPKEPEPQKEGSAAGQLDLDFGEGGRDA